MPDYVIREAADEDGPALVAMLTSVWSAYEGCVFDVAEHPYMEAPASRIADSGGRLWVLARDGEAVGSLGLLPSARPGDFDLILTALEPQSRGRGFATAMLAGANAFASVSGGERLGLWIDPRLVDGVRFAERTGFVREPGVRARQDGSDAVESRFTRDVEPLVSSQPSEALPADGG